MTIDFAYIHWYVELITSVSKSCTETIVSSGALAVLLDLVTQSNRSSASLLVIKTIIRILLNVCKVSLSQH